MSTEDAWPLLAVAAKRVAEGRRHGCHYFEATCPECLAIAESVLRAIITEEPAEGALVQMANRASSSPYDPRERRVVSISIMRAGYRGMPIWRVLWGE